MRKHTCFIYSNPTVLYFGDDVREYLIETLRGVGKKVLMTYGGGSINKNGIYDDVMYAMKETI